MKLTKLIIFFLLLSLKGFSQQPVVTPNGERVVLYYLSLWGGTISGTLSITGATTISGTTNIGGLLTTSGGITNNGALTNNGNATITGTLGITGNTTISGTTTLTGINNTGTITNTGALINTGKLIVGASSAASASAVLEASSTTQGFLPPRMTEAQRNAISSAVAGLVVWCSNCGSGELQVHNGTTWINMIGGTAAVPYTIGQAALGGKIAYILQLGDPGYDANVVHGLVATVADISTGAEWGCYETSITGADGTAIGTGKQNTIDIMAGCATPGIAARLCGDLVEGGYSDWYLPSINELSKLYINRVAIGGFVSTNYLSSTEDNSDRAWFQDFGSGLQDVNFKDYTYYVRAIRSF